MSLLTVYAHHTPKIEYEGIGHLRCRIGAHFEKENVYRKMLCFSLLQRARAWGLPFILWLDYGVTVVLSLRAPFLGGGTMQKKDHNVTNSKEEPPPHTHAHKVSRKSS